MCYFPAFQLSTPRFQTRCLSVSYQHVGDFCSPHWVSPVANLLYQTAIRAFTVRRNFSWSQESRNRSREHTLTTLSRALSQFLFLVLCPHLFSRPFFFHLRTSVFVCILGETSVGSFLLVSALCTGFTTFSLPPPVQSEVQRLLPGLAEIAEIFHPICSSSFFEAFQ